MKKIITTLCMLVLSACTSTDPYTGEQKTSNTAKGAGIGAVAGAVIGAATASKNDRKNSVLTGAAAGAAAGGGIGYYMDRQEAALRQRMAETGVSVRREGDIIYLVMPGDITFDISSHEIKGDFHSVLNGVGLVLTEFKKTAIKVSGHTDSTGGAEFNQGLSERRADSVAQYLIQAGVAAGRVQSVGFGRRQPVQSNDTTEGRRANRRVELELLPLS